MIRKFPVFKLAPQLQGAIGINRGSMVEVVEKLKAEYKKMQEVCVATSVHTLNDNQ